jgi:hypothetical protein
MKILHHRRQVSFSAKRLRSARRLYVHLCSKALIEATDNSVMTDMTLKMRERQLYADQAPLPCWREYRFRILRYLWKQKGQGCEWHFWYRSQGYDQNFSKVRQSRIA